MINIFERAGYHNYADIVRNAACSVEGEMDINDKEALPQPKIFPNPAPNPPLSPTLSSSRLSICDEYVEVNSAVAQNLPEGKEL